MIYYVAKNGDDHNKGSKESPFLTIQRAADIADAGDRIGRYCRAERQRRTGKAVRETGQKWML